jgi:hypothetical protein
MNATLPRLRKLPLEGIMRALIALETSVDSPLGAYPVWPQQEIAHVTRR